MNNFIKKPRGVFNAGNIRTGTSFSLISPVEIASFTPDVLFLE